MSNKQDLIAIIQANTEAGLETKAAAERAVNAVIGAIEEGLKKDGSVQLVGFGTFQVKERAARKGRNPKTGETISIAASKNIAFKAGASLKSSLAPKAAKAFKKKK